MHPDIFTAANRVFAGVRFDVHTVELDGRGGGKVRREAVVAPDAVVVLPMLDDGRVVLIRNERFVVGRTLWELCAGTIEEGEAPEACAARELVEETGYRPRKLEPMTRFFPTPGMATERMHAYLATGLTHVGQDLDTNEKIVVELVAYDAALEMVRTNKIEDGKTIAALLYYETFMRK